MPATKEFKFNCPDCGQHILADTKWVGRGINCPSCNVRISVPPPGSELKKPAPVVPSSQTPRQTPPQGPPPIDKPANEAGPSAAAVPAPSAPTKQDRAEAAAPRPTALPSKPAIPGPPTPEPTRVAVLSPTIKLEMVRSVRRRIADECAWLPGKVKGATAYAAKMQNGELVLLDATSPEATRFSLIGAFLLEMQTRQVVRTAVGRKRFLDEEIPEAIRETLLDPMSDEEREHAEESLAGQDLQSISHEQCLMALERLEERYLQRAEHLQIERAKRRLGAVRLPDLVKKLEKKVGLSSEEVATALYHELMDVRRRLESLERRATRNKSAPTDEN